MYVCVCVWRVNKKAAKKPLWRSELTELGELTAPTELVGADHAPVSLVTHADRHRSYLAKASLVRMRPAVTHYGSPPDREGGCPAVCPGRLTHADRVIEACASELGSNRAPADRDFRLPPASCEARVSQQTLSAIDTLVGNDIANLGDTCRS